MLWVSNSVTQRLWAHCLPPLMSSLIWFIMVTILQARWSEIPQHFVDSPLHSYPSQSYPCHIQQFNKHARTLLLNNGAAPNTKSAINSFLWQDFPRKFHAFRSMSWHFPYSCQNSRTFPGLPRTWLLCFAGVKSTVTLAIHHRLTGIPNYPSDDHHSGSNHHTGYPSQTDWYTYLPIWWPPLRFKAHKMKWVLCLHSNTGMTLLCVITIWLTAAAAARDWLSKV